MKKVFFRAIVRGFESDGHLDMIFLKKLTIISTIIRLGKSFTHESYAIFSKEANGASHRQVKRLFNAVFCDGKSERCVKTENGRSLCGFVASFLDK